MAPAGDDRWLENQGALLRQAPDLAAAVSAVDAGRWTGRTADGRWFVKRNRARLALELSPAQVVAALDGVAVPREVRVVGVGLGELVLAALSRWPEARVVAWDREPEVLRIAMTSAPLAPHLLSGRLVLMSGAMPLDLPPAGEGTAVVEHPVLAPLWRPEWAAVTGTGPFAVLGDGGLFSDDLHEILSERGFRCWRMDLGTGAGDHTVDTLGRLAPAVVAHVNHITGLAEACSAAGVPYVEWEIDPAMDTKAPAAGPTSQAHLFTWRRRHVAEWRDAGFEHVSYLPLAANVRRRRPPPDADTTPYRVPVAFVGNSLAERIPDLRAMVQGLMERWAGRQGLPDPAGRARALVQHAIAECQRALPRFVAGDVLEAACPGIHALAAAEGLRWEPALVLGEIAGAIWRLHAVGALGPLGAHVWGDPGWRAVEPAGVRYRGFAGHSTELTRIYAGAAVNVDIGRIYQADIVTMRVFDVLACGGFLLAAWSERLGELFDLGAELETWRTLPELVEKTRYFLDHPDERSRLVQAGRARVLRDHTIRGRVETMLRAAGVTSPRPGAVALD